jgi:hypothetical protein
MADANASGEAASSMSADWNQSGFPSTSAQARETPFTFSTHGMPTVIVFWRPDKKTPGTL